MIDRRSALSALVGMAASPGLAAAGDDRPPVRDAFGLTLGKPIEILAHSNPIRWGERDANVTYVVTVEKAGFDLDGESRLTAKLRATLVQMARVDYWISAAVYDADGRLLGAASHKESVRRVVVGRVVATTREIALDFGVSKGYARAAFASVVVGERDLPAAPDGKG